MTRIGGELRLELPVVDCKAGMLVSRTPFRAITAVPLTGALIGVGTMDFYF
jgi:hypothetical protein